MELLAEFFVVCGWKGRPSVGKDRLGWWENAHAVRVCESPTPTDTSLPPLSRLYAPDVLTHYPCTSRFDRNAVKTVSVYPTGRALL